MTEERQKRELPVRHSFLTEFVNSALDVQSKPHIPQIDNSTLIKITSDISNCIDNGEPEPIPLPSEDITPKFRVLSKRPPAKFPHIGPINEDFYQIRHKKHEMEEKKQKNREKERLEHDLYQQIQLVDKLKAVDKSTLASIVNSLRHQRNDPHLAVDLDQLHSTLLQEAREQLYRYEQLGLGRKRAQGHTPLRPPMNNHTLLLQQPESLDDDLPFTYETLLPLKPPLPPSLPIRTSNKKANILVQKKHKASPSSSPSSSSIEKKKKNVIVVSQEPSKLSSSLPSTSTETSPSLISSPPVLQRIDHNNISETTTMQLDSDTEIEKNIISNKSSSSSSSSSISTEKLNEDKKLKEAQVLNYFRSRGGSSHLSSNGQRRRSMRTAIVFGEKVPFLDTIEFSLPLDQFGDLMKKRNT